MNIETSNQPAVAAGAHISRLLKAHSGDVVVLLSGGSALDVFEYIDAPHDTGTATFECRTIFMMGDERVTGKEKINNYLQLKSRYKDHPLIGCVIDTSAQEAENPENYATRIRKIFFEKYFSKLHNPKIFMILGMGTDGHTAGIFPLDEESFAKMYEADSMYVPVHAEGLTIDSRASFTPGWILESVDAVIGYVVGDGKAAMLNQLKTESKPIHERPAEILKRHKNSTVYTDIKI